MHTHQCVVLVTAVAVLASARIAAADDTSPRVLIETDPATFVFDGYSVHARLAPGDTRWSIGAGVYAMDLPDAMIALAPANRDEDWHGRIAGGYGLFVDRFVQRAGTGWFVGGQAAIQRFEMTRDVAPGVENHHVVGLLMARAGYSWTPTRHGLYLMPWVGVGATAPLWGERALAGQQYQVFPVVAFATLHVGWQF